MDDHAPDLTAPPALDELLADLDAILDAWFLDEVQPALDDAQRARADAAA
jgi:hypothetical protein